MSRALELRVSILGQGYGLDILSCKIRANGFSFLAVYCNGTKMRFVSVYSVLNRFQKSSVLVSGTQRRHFIVSFPKHHSSSSSSSSSASAAALSAPASWSSSPLFPPPFLFFLLDFSAVRIECQNHLHFPSPKVSGVRKFTFSLAFCRSIGRYHAINRLHF